MYKEYIANPPSIAYAQLQNQSYCDCHCRQMVQWPALQPSGFCLDLCCASILFIFWTTKALIFFRSTKPGWCAISSSRVHTHCLLKAPTGVAQTHNRADKQNKQTNVEIGHAWRSRQRVNETSIAAGIISVKAANARALGSSLMLWAGKTISNVGMWRSCLLMVINSLIVFDKWICMTRLPTP